MQTPTSLVRDRGSSKGPSFSLIFFTRRSSSGVDDRMLFSDWRSSRSSEPSFPRLSPEHLIELPRPIDGRGSTGVGGVLGIDQAGADRYRCLSHCRRREISKCRTTFATQ